MLQKRLCIRRRPLMAPTDVVVIVVVAVVVVVAAVVAVVVVVAKAVAAVVCTVIVATVAVVSSARLPQSDGLETIHLGQSGDGRLEIHSHIAP